MLQTFSYQQYSENYCFVKSNICWGVELCGGGGVVLGISGADAQDAWGRPASLQIRALNYKVFTNANSWGKSSALICVMVSVTGD